MIEPSHFFIMQKYRGINNAKTHWPLLTNYTQIINRESLIKIYINLTLIRIIKKSDHIWNRCVPVYFVYVCTYVYVVCHWVEFGGGKVQMAIRDWISLFIHLVIRDWIVFNPISVSIIICIFLHTPSHSWCLLNKRLGDLRGI